MKSYMENMYDRAAPLPWQKIRTSRKSMRNVLRYIAKDFLSLIGFMIVYRKYPYHLAYHRINEMLYFLDSFMCRNKQEIISEYLFGYIETVDEAKSWLQVHYRRVLEWQSEPDSNERNWAAKRYIISNKIPAKLSDNAPENLLKFKQLFLMAAENQRTIPFYRLSHDIWRCACEYLLMEHKDVDPQHVKKIEHLLTKGLTDDDR